MHCLQNLWLFFSTLSGLNDFYMNSNEVFLSLWNTCLKKIEYINKKTIVPCVFDEWHVMSFVAGGALLAAAVCSCTSGWAVLDNSCLALGRLIWSSLLHCQCLWPLHFFYTFLEAGWHISVAVDVWTSRAFFSVPFVLVIFFGLIQVL